MPGANAAMPAKQIESAGHAHQTTSFVLPLDGDVDWPAFTVCLSPLLHCPGDRILRVKVKLYAPSTGQPLIIPWLHPFFYPPVHLVSVLFLLLSVYFLSVLLYLVFLLFLL